MRDLKTIGAHNVTEGRSRSLTGKGKLQQLIASYEQFRNNGILPVSYEVVYGHAWIAEEASAHSMRVSFEQTK
jgi:malonyl-CoA O-methyltransferase